MDELVERLGRGALRFAQQNALIVASVVPVFVVSVLPIRSGQAVVLVSIFSSKRSRTPSAGRARPRSTGVSAKAGERAPT